MVSPSAFAPDWASPPGDTLRDAMRDQGITLDQVASDAELSVADLQGVLSGDAEITLALAQGLAKAVGATAQFWVNRECQYRDDLARAGLQHWVSKLPTKEMVRLGWLPATKSPDDLIRRCLDFFQVSDVTAWGERRAVLELARYRSARSVPLDDGASLAWLQEARRRAHRGPQVAQWNREGLRDVITRIRPLTLDKDPRNFIPTLCSALGRVGVRLVVLQAPHGSAISGASLLLEDATAMIALTARHLSDDHFWFTLCHEAGHLILQDTSRIFMDDLDGGESADEHEREADEFASSLLVPQLLLDELPSSRTPTSREIIRACVRHKVAPGIVVGHLQHEGVLSYRSLNTLKRRYRWDGPTLEKA